MIAMCGRGLFKGNMATVLKVAPQSAVQFAVFDTGGHAGGWG